MRAQLLALKPLLAYNQQIERRKPLASKWDELVVRQVTRFAWGDEPAPFITNRLRELREEHGCKTVLDVGCGDGRHVVALAEQGFEVTGVDFSSESLARCETKLREKSLRATLIQADVTRLRINDFLWFPKIFDAVISTKVLKHIHPQWKALARILRHANTALLEFSSLRDGGLEVARELGAATNVGWRKWSISGAPHRYTTPREIEAIFLVNGFKVTRMEKIIYDDSPHPGLIERPHTHESLLVEATPKPGRTTLPRL